MLTYEVVIAWAAVLGRGTLQWSADFSGKYDEQWLFQQLIDQSQPASHPAVTSCRLLNVLALGQQHTLHELAMNRDNYLSWSWSNLQTAKHFLFADIARMTDIRCFIWGGAVA